MIWLASFPRSGNTFFRNILFEVYGITSNAYSGSSTANKKSNFQPHQVVKTHLLPSELPVDWRDAKSVYLVRDARDALLSMAHHRKDLIAPESEFQTNLTEAILAAGGSHFGGWTENTRQWVAKADIIIRFEDLILDPIGEVEKLRAIIDLPPPDVGKLPTFKQLKFGIPKYGARVRNMIGGTVQNQKMFRKGKAGGWKEELSLKNEHLIYQEHGEQMKALGYSIRDLDRLNQEEPFTIEKVLKWFRKQRD